MKSKRTVLVVEDALLAREYLCTVLKDDGFEVYGCDDGTTALAVAAETDFQIIITDYRMPNMSGVDVTRQLRMRFPVSIIIGVSFDDKRDDFLEAGADAFLLKPYQLDDLAKLMNSRC